MSDAAALLAAIRAAPDDDAPRLIYADWLDEHGQPERAEFIRVQIELDRNESTKLRLRESDLLAEHHDAFAGALAAPGLRFRFERGFIVGLGHSGVFVSPTVTGNYMFRFYPDGSFISGRFGQPPHEITQRFQRGHHRGHLDGTYAIDAIENTARIRITYAVKTSMRDRPSYDAVLEVPWLVLFAEGRSERFKLFPIPGFDSFSET
jgi:uncharacterized protein (TIGR02996 family)